MSDAPKRSSSKSDPASAEPAADERSWFAVKTQQAGASQYLAADEDDARAMHERIIPGDTIISVTPV